jgi:hypothetical protein
MNWETVTSGIGQKVYALWNNGRKLLTLAFQTGSNYVRIEYGGEKRAFIIRYEGILKNKMVMRNEYGVRIGQVKVENNENLIALNDEKLHYYITTDTEPKLILYKDSKEIPLAVCDLHVENDKNILPSMKGSATQHSLLLALCWYLFHPVTKETKREFA